MSEALRVGKPALVEAGATLADGLLVPMVGANAFEITRKFVDK
jgi:threonine dehydratase